MNKLDLSGLGGHPLNLDDLEFLQNALADGIKGLASFWSYLADDPVIISGLNATVSGTDVIYTSGYVVVNSEIYFVDGGTFATAPSYIDISQTVDTNGDKVYEDLSNHSTYLVRKGVLTAIPGPNTIDLVDFLTVKNVMATKGIVVDNSTAWINIGSGGTAPAFNSSWVNVSSGTFNGSDLRFKKTKTGEIVIDGSCVIPVIGSIHLIFTLPVGYRPVSAKRFSVIGNNNAVNSNWDIIITTNGNVSVYNMSSYDNTSSLQLSLDNIRFFTD